MGRSFWCILMAFMYIIWKLHDHFRKLIDSSEDERKSRASSLKIFKQFIDPPSWTISATAKPETASAGLITIQYGNFCCWLAIV